MQEYKQLNILFKDIETYISSLERKLSLVLGDNWTISIESQIESIGTFTHVELIGPNSVKIKSRYQLAEFCKQKNIDFKKVQFLTFMLYNFHSNTKIYTVHELDTAMSRALKRIAARKYISKINL